MPCWVEASARKPGLVKFNLIYLLSICSFFRYVRIGEMQGAEDEVCRSIVAYVTETEFR